jgi:predicted enzyme related to lactoylglutathione lyase
MPLESAPLVAFVASKDLRRARGFYEGSLGLTLVEESAFACAFDANGTQLRVTAVKDHTPPSNTVLGWEVPDIEAAIAGLAERGVALARYDSLEQDEFGTWHAPGGARIAWFEDPDGNVLSLTQR